ncbi:MAG: MFS transporter [Chloroflexi bacterium]|nr:MFS transporter [Chloroflexota bacterium]
MLQKISATYNEFPKSFWVLMGSSFIDRLGGALLFPFFSLYVRDHFKVDMVEVGVIFSIFAITGVLGSFLGGAMTDRFGRRAMMIYGLVISASSSLLMAYVDDLQVFYIITVVVGLLSNVGGPAQQAMIADLLPEKKHAEGYGIWRVVANLAVTFGPLIGGLLIASVSFRALFFTDAVTSLIMAIIVLRVLPETKPAAPEGEEEESFGQTLGGYRRVLTDKVYMAFILISILVFSVYIQMNTTMPVYLDEVQSIPAAGYGYILSMNAGMVVLFQFWITRRLTGSAPLRVMALGALLYGIGFALYGVNSTIYFYAFAMVIITIGEMVIVPVSQAIAVRFAPAHMRGRYLAIFGFAYAIPFGIGPIVAGLVMENSDPRWVWWGGGIICVIGVVGYLLLHTRVNEQLGLMEEGGETSMTGAVAEA